MTILGISVIVLVVVALVQLMKVFNLTQELKGEREEVVSTAENRKQGRYLMVFMFGYFGFFIWLLYKYGHLMLPEAASVHGESIDLLLNINFAIIILAFVITHIVLFYFSYKYYGRPDRKVEFFTHSNKLELAWTVVPAVVLAFIIIYGLSTWNKIMTEPENPLVVELYSKQFDWTARYAGPDGKLGDANYRFISLASNNPLGLITDNTINEKLNELDEKISELEVELAEAFPGGKIAKAIEDKITSVQKHKDFVMKYKTADRAFDEANDDVITKVEFHLPVNKPVKFYIKAQDVIHSAYMPHFRAQMNAVPGMQTTFSFIPNKTTAEMREITGNPEFDYLLYCNKICGSAHYNMQMKIIVESEEEYNAWMAKQKTFSGVQVAEIQNTLNNSEIALKN